MREARSQGQFRKKWRSRLARAGTQRITWPEATGGTHIRRLGGLGNSLARWGGGFFYPGENWGPLTRQELAKGRVRLSRQSRRYWPNGIHRHMAKRVIWFRGGHTLSCTAIQLISGIEVRFDSEWGKSHQVCGGVKVFGVRKIAPSPLL